MAHDLASLLAGPALTGTQQVRVSGQAAAPPEGNSPARLRFLAVHRPAAQPTCPIDVVALPRPSRVRPSSPVSTAVLTASPRRPRLASSQTGAPSLNRARG